MMTLDFKRELFLDMGHEDFYDLVYVLQHGAEKHGHSNWKTTSVEDLQFFEYHDSMFHHLADSRTSIRHDKESGLDPLLHLATRALMLYTKLKQLRSSLK